MTTAVSHLNDCGIQADTKVRCAGNNMYGELGTTTGNLQYHVQYSPAYYSTGTTVPNLIGATVLSTGGGSFDSVCILNTSGKLLCWGGRILLPSDPQFSYDSVGDAINLSLAANPTPTASPSGAIFWRP
jgi:hypothetical protein